MPKVDFCFQGWVRGAEIKEVTITETGNKLDVTDVDPQTLIANLDSGVWCISLGDYLYSNRKSEIEMHDFEPSDD
jgi:hypothetical protein